MVSFLQYVRTLLVVCSVLLLSACGFHLRNEAMIPAQFKILCVTSNSSYAASTKQIKQTLRNLGVQLVDQADSAPYTLVLLEEAQNQQLLGSSTNNQLQTYQLNYTLRYQLNDQQGRVVVPAHSVNVMRSFTSNPNQALSQNYERALLLRDMQNEAINQLLYQLNSEQVQQQLQFQTTSA